MYPFIYYKPFHYVSMKISLKAYVFWSILIFDFIKDQFITVIMSILLSNLNLFLYHLRYINTVIFMYLLFIYPNF